jgi:hypothetical protein
MAPVSSAEQIAGLAQAGLVVYGAPLSSAQGEYVLAGAPAEALKRLPAEAQVRVLDADMAGGVYYLAYPPPASDQRAGALRWAEYGRVLLDLGDQVLLRTGEAEMIRLADAGADVVLVTLEPAKLGGGVEAWPEAITPDPRVAAMLGQVTTQAITDRTAELSGEVPTTVGGAPVTITSRYTYSGTPVQKAGQYVGERMQALGLGVEYHVWGTSGTPSTYPNVIGQRTGTTNPNDIYIIGGHLDNLPSSGLAYGADDNGSGSVATLLAAQILTQYEWSCTLRFAFWTGEEQGLLGSAAYATRAKNANETIKGYLNMDMIAYNGGAPNEINLFAKSTVPGSVAMMDLYADAISAYGLNLVPIKYTNNTLGDRSDNKSFWDRGYASMLAIEDYYGDFNPRYHTINDRLQYLDMAYYTDFVKASLATFVHMSGCLVTPPTPTPTWTATPTEEPTATPTWTATPTEEPTATPTEEPTATPTWTATPTEEPTATPTEEPTATPTWTATPTEEPTATPTWTATPTEEPTATPTWTATPTAEPTATPTNTPTATATPAPGEVLYVSSTTGGTAGGVSFADEDILTFDRSSGVWSMFFDGSDVGVGGVDIDAVSLQGDGSILMSFDAAITLGSLGTVADADIVRFTPTSTGSTTAGAFSWYFDGSDVGLTNSSEDIDAIGFTPDGRLVISTEGAVAVTGVSGADEDLLVFTATQLGATTSGTWAMYFDGSDVGLSNTSSEDVNGAWIDPATGKIYLTTLGAFSVTGVSGDGADVFICTPSSLGPTTACTFAMHWDGSANGFAGEVMDALDIVR